MTRGLWVIALVITLGATTYARDGAALYERVHLASVEILIEGQLSGSGWLAAPEGLIVTAGHVIWGRDESAIEILSPTLGRLEAKRVAVDRGHDLALLRIESAKEPYPILELAEQFPDPTSEVYLFGAALNRHAVLIRGAVARAKPTYEYFSKEQQYTRVYHVSAPSPPGTSGGCWMDANGRVIGNQSGFVTSKGAGAGLAQIAPLEAIRRLIQTQKSAATPTLETAFEELWSQSPGFIRRFPKKAAGLVPVLAKKDGVAQRAGLTGDVLITAIDDQPVMYRDAFLQTMRAKKPGDSVTLTLMMPDDGPPRRVTISLGSLE